MGLGDAFDNTAPTPKSLGTTSFDNTAPVDKEIEDLTVVACATSNIDLSAGFDGLTIDGVELTLDPDEMVLLTGQTAPNQNGVHLTTVSDSTGIASRPARADSSAELIGLGVKVSGGTVGKNKRWRCTNTTTITIGTTAVTFADQSATPKTL